MSCFHPGVNTCEACKGFFRRCLARKTSLPLCSKGGDCGVNLDDRNSCPACRYKKCTLVGMSKSGTSLYRFHFGISGTNYLVILCFSFFVSLISQEINIPLANAVRKIVRSWNACFSSIIECSYTILFYSLFCQSLSV